MILLTEAQFWKRADDMTARFDRLGEVRVHRRDDPDGARFGLKWLIIAPFAATPLGRFEYEEIYARSARQFELVKYAYDFLDIAHGGRRGYHWHIIPGRREVAEPHAHCSTAGTASEPHFRYIPMGLIEAHEDLERLYAADKGITCNSLLPLLD